MSPHLSTRGKSALAAALIWLFAGCVLLLMGRASIAWLVLSAASALLMSLGLLFYAAIPLGKAVDKAIDFSLSPPQKRAFKVNTPLHLNLNIQNNSRLTLRTLKLQPELATPLKPKLDSIPPLALKAHTKASFLLELSARRCGRWFVHGFRLTAVDISGFFSIDTYRPAPCPISFVPKTGLSRGTPPLRLRRTQLHIGAHRAISRGFGSELRELREHQYGDPFRNIAWKATARLNQLMVRDFESDLSLDAYIAIDISSSMRSTSAQTGKLEHAIELALHFADALLTDADRCGLITFDERVYGHIPATSKAPSINDDSETTSSDSIRSSTPASLSTTTLRSSRSSCATSCSNDASISAPISAPNADTRSPSKRASISPY